MEQDSQVQFNHVHQSLRRETIALLQFVRLRQSRVDRRNSDHITLSTLKMAMVRPDIERCLQEWSVDYVKYAAYSVYIVEQLKKFKRITRRNVRSAVRRIIKCCACRSVEEPTSVESRLPCYERAEIVDYLRRRIGTQE